MDDEEWRPVYGFEGHYEVSDHGRVRSVDRVAPHPHSGTCLRKGKVLSLFTTPLGYQRAEMSRNGMRAHAFVHELVLEAFVGPRPYGQQCLHGPGGSLDNRLSNLRWGTPSENVREVVESGNHAQARKTECKHGHKFTPENTRVSAGKRICRSCAKERARRYREEKKQWKTT